MTITMTAASPAEVDRPRIWSVTTAGGRTTTGHLPAWAKDDPSQTDVPDEQLGKVLADICHWTPFPGQEMQVASDGGPGTDTVILGGSIDFHPYADNTKVTIPSSGLPVAHLQIVDDYWIHDLDPFALATIIAQLRTQADHIDTHVRPALIAARHDWAITHPTT